MTLVEKLHKKKLTKSDKKLNKIDIVVLERALSEANGITLEDWQKNHRLPSMKTRYFE